MGMFREDILCYGGFWKVNLLTSKAMEVSLADMNETLQICRVQKNNQHVFFHFGENSSLRVETILRISGVVSTFELELVISNF